MLASSKDVLAGRWKVVSTGAMAYSAYAPLGVKKRCMAATLWPTANSVMLGPREVMVPAMSWPWLKKMLGFEDCVEKSHQLKRLKKFCGMIAGGVLCMEVCTVPSNQRDLRRWR